MNALPEEALRQVVATGLPPVVPGYLPEGFVFSRVHVESDPDFGSRYQIDFVGPDQQRLSIEATDGGVGDVFPGDESFPVDPGRLGPAQVELYQDAEPVELRSTWLELGEAIFAGVSGEGVEPDEVCRFTRELVRLEG